MITFEKDPQARLDYAIDWSARLETGETITNAVWVVDSGLTVATSPGPSIDGARTVVWFEGGTLGQVYSATVHVTTSAGREDDRTFRVAIRDM